MTYEEELELVKQAQENIQAFDKLYRYYVKKIYSYCLYRVASAEIAEDVTSQVFLSACEKIHNFDVNRGTKFSSWLYQSAHNKVIDTYRKNSKITNYELRDDEVASDDSQEEEVNLTFLQKQIAEVLPELKDRYQQIITLRFYSELDIPEIAEVMKMKPTNVSVLLHRALNSFRKKFKKKFPETEIFDLI